ncbi:MAG: hypothetical protein AAF620_20285 [Bacteroidota bacterium]
MKYLIYSVFLVLFFNCSKEEKSTAISEQIIEENLKFSKEVQYVIDVANQVNENGLITKELKDSSRLDFLKRNNKIDSTLTTFFESGSLKMLINFKNGDFAHGAHAEYYDKEIELMFRTDTDTFVQTEPMIKRYYFTDHHGRLKYMRNYDSAGNATKSIGKLILTLKLTATEYSVYDTIPLQVYVVGEPYPTRYYDLSTELKFQVLRRDSVIKELRPDINPDYSCAFIFETIEEPGQYDLRVIAKYSDIFWSSEGDSIPSIMTDTSVVRVKIKPLELSYSN